MRRLFLIFFGLFLIFSASAQTPANSFHWEEPDREEPVDVVTPMSVPTDVGMVKHVEVSKEYAPSLGHAEKLSIPYDGGDTTMMRPAIDYTVVPRAESTRFETSMIAPSTLTYWDFDRPLPFYAKVGGGFPWSSSVDLYAATQHPDVGHAVVYVNHDGLYQNPKSLGGSGTWMDNRAGGRVGRYFGRRLLEGEIDYHHIRSDRKIRFPDLLIWNAEQKHEPGVQNANYNPTSQDLWGAVRFGDSFTDLSRLNFAIEAGGGRFWEHPTGYEDEGTFGDFDRFNLLGSVGRAFGKHVARLDLGFDASIGKDWFYRTWNIGGKYDYKTEKVDMRFGLSYVFDDLRHHNGSSHYILPDAHFRFDIQNGAFVPFVELKSELFRNDARALLAQNSYYLPKEYDAKAPKSTVHYAIRGGVSGNVLNDIMSYHLSIGYQIISNYNFWYAWSEGDYRHFDLAQGRLNSLGLTGGLDVRPLSDLVVSLRLNLASRTFHSDYTPLLPELEGRIGVRYRHKVFSIEGHLDLASARDLTLVKKGEDSSEKITLPFCAEFGFEFDWYALEWLTVYAEARNLFNGPTYDWSRPMQVVGPGFQIGVKFSF